VDERVLSDYAEMRLQDVRSGVEALQSIDLIEWDETLGCWSVLRQSEGQPRLPIPTTVERLEKTGDTTPRAVVCDKYSALTNREIVNMIIESITELSKPPRDLAGAIVAARWMLVLQLERFLPRTTQPAPDAQEEEE
jgi:hypothetical protein